jgi:tetratricopeptide (TPR) repeat protein
MYNALSWLTHFENTHLRRTTQAMLRHLNDMDVDEDKRQQMIETALEQSRANPDQLECPELLLHLAAQYFADDDLSMALEYTRQARQFYAEGTHQNAVAAWMQGIAAWKSEQNWLAFTCWYDARQAFGQLARQQEDAGNHANAGWYLNLLERLDMNLAVKPEEAYTWLDYFDPSRLSANALAMVEEISQLVNQEVLTESDQQNILARVNELNALGTNSVDPLESAEVLVECAMIHYRLAGFSKAAGLLDNAVQIFPPNSHQQAVTLWLQGLMEWHSLAARGQSIAHGTESHRLFAELAQLSGQSARPEQAAWYTAREDTLLRILRKRKQTLDQAGTAA